MTAQPDRIAELEALEASLQAERDAKWRGLRAADLLLREARRNLLLAKMPRDEDETPEASAAASKSGESDADHPCTACPIRPACGDFDPTEEVCRGVYPSDAYAGNREVAAHA